MGTQKGLWLAWECAGNGTVERAHGLMAVLYYVLVSSLMLARRIVETQKSQWKVSGVERRETALFSGNMTSLFWILFF